MLSLMFSPIAYPKVYQNLRDQDLGVHTFNAYNEIESCGELVKYMNGHLTTSQDG